MTRIQAMVFALLVCGPMDAAEPIHIGSRLELLIDDHLVARNESIQRHGKAFRISGRPGHVDAEGTRGGGGK